MKSGEFLVVFVAVLGLGSAVDNHADTAAVNLIREVRQAETNRSYNRALIFSTVLDEPYTMQRDPDDPTSLRGYIPDLVEKIAERKNFAFRLQLVKDGRYGSKGSEGWNGLVGEVLRREVDAAAAPLTVTFERQAAVDFTKPFMNTGIGFLVRKPLPAGLSPWHWLVRPFTRGVWLAAVGSWVLVWILIIIINRFSPYEWEKKYKRGVANKIQAKYYSSGNSYFSISSMLFWQGYEHGPASVSGRFLIIGWWGFVAIFAAAYMAGLTASLISEDKLTAVDMYMSAEDLARSDMNYGGICGGSSESFFTRSNVETLLKIGAKMTSEGNCVKSTADGLERVRQSAFDYAFLGEAKTLSYMSAKDCGVITIDPYIGLGQYGIAIHKSNPRLLTDFNDALVSLQEEGYLDRLYEKWWLSDKCADVTTLTQRSKGNKGSPVPLALPIDLIRFAFAFIWLLAFVILAILCLIIESIFYRARGKNKVIVNDGGEGAHQRLRDPDHSGVSKL